MEGRIMADIKYTDLVGIPFGNTANRPASPAIGQTYNNGTTGILEIYTATGWIGLAGAPPVPPTSIVATDVGTSLATNNGSTSVSFTSGVGGGLSLDYILTSSPATTQVTGSSSPITITGLTGGTSYTYTVQGRNNFGTSSSSAASSSVVATSVPYPPTSVSATPVSGTTNITVAWTLGSNAGKSLSSISIKPYLNGVTAEAPQAALSASSVTHNFTGLTQGANYTFTVTATNANGTSIESSASNSVTIPSIVSTEYLVIAGGGGGANRSYKSGGGGGAGGYLTGTLSLLKGTNYTVTVGAGGGGGYGGQGSNSVFSSITSAGGGGGAYGGAGANGGSGGGACGDDSGSAAGLATPAGQGNNGGNTTASPALHAAGGGGAGAVGGNSSASQGGAGGNGLSSSITGTSVTYAGGGGGARKASDYNYPSGGTGGGGYGGTASIGGLAGTANTGGGGGGSCLEGDNAGAGRTYGGSGVVILKYLTSSGTITVGAGLTSSTSTSGSYTIRTITAGTGNVSFS